MAVTATPALRVAVDVQHLYRASHPGDRGSLYTLANGKHVAEAELATQYAGGIIAGLRARGLEVLTNNPAAGVLVGEYWTRQRAAAAWGANVYLACHVNAGRGGYALAEAMSTTPGVQLAGWVVNALARRFPPILDGRTVALHAGERGAVCVQSFPSRGAAVILEPFFGDNPAHQALAGAAALLELGQVIAQGVMDWYAGARPTTLP